MNNQVFSCIMFVVIILPKLELEVFINAKPNDKGKLMLLFSCAMYVHESLVMRLNSTNERNRIKKRQTFSATS